MSVNQKIWNLDEVKKVIPLVCAILKTVRENYLCSRFCERKIQIINSRHGRRSKVELIEIVAKTRKKDRAEQEMRESLDELHRLGAYCLDPVQSVAFFPTMAENYLLPGCASNASYCYSPNEELYWRYHNDPESTKRRI